MDGLKAICKTEEASQTAFLQDASDIGCTSTRRGIFEKDIITTEEKGIKERRNTTASGMRRMEEWMEMRFW